MATDKVNVEPASFCSFCGVRGRVAVSEQVESAGVRICGPCTTWAADELRKAGKSFPKPTAEELARPHCQRVEIAPGMTATMLLRPVEGPLDRTGLKRCWKCKRQMPAASICAVCGPDPASFGEPKKPRAKK